MNPDFRKLKKKKYLISLIDLFQYLIYVIQIIEKYYL